MSVNSLLDNTGYKDWANLYVNSLQAYGSLTSNSFNASNVTSSNVTVDNLNFSAVNSSPLSFYHYEEGVIPMQKNGDVAQFNLSYKFFQLGSVKHLFIDRSPFLTIVGNSNAEFQSVNTLASISPFLNINVATGDLYVHAIGSNFTDGNKSATYARLEHTGNGRLYIAKDVNAANYTCTIGQTGYLYGFNFVYY